MKRMILAVLLLAAPLAAQSPVVELRTTPSDTCEQADHIEERGPE